MRRIPRYKLSTPLQPLVDDIDISQTEEFDLARVCEVMGYLFP
jgi:hypothetical protein